MGESNRDEEARKLQGELGGWQNELRGTDFSANNRFNNYKTPFGYKDMSAQLKQLTDLGIQDVNRTAEGQISAGQQDTAARMASQGITGGSVLNNQVGANRNNVNKSRFNAIQGLKSNNVNANLGAMNMENQNDFRNTSAAQNVDLENLMAKFRKYGMIGGVYGQKQGNLQNISDDTWLTDALSILNTGAGLLNPLDDLFSGSGDTSGAT